MASGLASASSFSVHFIEKFWGQCMYAYTYIHIHTKSRQDIIIDLVCRHHHDHHPIEITII